MPSAATRINPHLRFEHEFVSYYVRTNDRGVRHEISYIHELMRQGIYFESYLRNLTGVAEKILSNSEKLLQASTKPKKAISAFDIYQNL